MDCPVEEGDVLCGRPTLAHRMCRKHYLRWYKHGDPLIVGNRWGLDRDAVTKVCTKCNRELPVDDFYKRSETGRPISRCKECYKKRPQDVLRLNLKRVGLTVEQFDAMLLGQDGACAICATPAGQREGRLSVDHDHVTGRIRALLCYRCNSGIGMFSDNPDLLHAAIAYLELYGAAHQDI